MRRSVKILLCALSGALFGLAFPPVGAGILAVFGFVPLLLLLAADDTASEVFRHSFVAFLVFNIVTLYWPGGFTHQKDPYLMVSGILLLLANPMIMSIPMLVWYSARRGLGLTRALIAFPFIWVGFEYAHASTQMSFPWLTLGYTMSYDLDAIQMASVGGVYLVTFWIVVLNVLLFILLSRAMVGGRGPGRIFTGGAVVLLVYALPYFCGPLLGVEEAAGDGKEVSVVLVQPNVDPFDKWSGAAAEQVAALRYYTDSLIAGIRHDLMVWPETAVPYYLLAPANAQHFGAIRAFVDSVGVPLLSGIPDLVSYPDATSAPEGAKRRDDGTAYETFNSSMLLLPGVDSVQKYAKAILVPFAERVPYSDVLSFLNAARWNFGLGGWSVGRDTALYRLPVAEGDTIRFANMICYESVYPGYVAGLARRGAGFLTVVTNDSWWGNTSGPYQHRQFAVLRAVENRRWIAQCANGGLSFVIDPSGRVAGETGMFTAGGLSGTLRSRTEQSFYSAHGDWFAEICLVLTLFVFATSVLQRISLARMRTFR